MDEQGLLTIYTVQNVAPKGLKAQYKLVEVTSAYYQELRVGVQRVYSALGANRKIDALVRCFNTKATTEQVVILDGKQFTVDITQKVIGKDAVDLTLVRMEKDYEIYTEPSNESVSGS